jgi:hypothetical protein
MTACRRTALSPHNDVLAGFDAEMARLMSLSEEDFATLDPHALTSIPATIRVIPSEVSSS